MLLDDLADLASTYGHGTVGTDVFKATLPSTPDAAVAIIHYGGLEPVRRMAASPGLPIAEVQRVQVLVRDSRYDGAAKTAQDIFHSLDGLARTVNGVAYRWISAIQSPFFLEYDGSNRAVIACNYEVVRDSATSS